MEQHRSNESFHSLTSESLCRRFNSTFDLVNYAIGMAEEVVLSGKTGALDPEQCSWSIPGLVLEAISEGKDQIDDVILSHLPPPKEEDDEEEEVNELDEEEELDEIVEEAAERDDLPVS